MEVQKIKEFFKKIHESSKEQLVEILKNDQEKITLIIETLASEPSHEITEVVNSNLFTLYHNGNDVQKALVLHFVPVLIWDYLYISSNHGKKGCGKLEAVLLAIYNDEVLTKDGEIKFQKFRLPSLSQPSMYHEPSLAKMSASALTESALSRHEQTEVMYRLTGPSYKLPRISACHRFAVVAFVLEQYNLFISYMSATSLHSACNMAIKAASCGYRYLCEKHDMLENISNSSRIALDNNTIVQLVYIMYYTMHNGYSKIATQAIEALHFRAAHGLFSQAFQLTSSIEHLLDSGKRQTLDCPLGLSVEKSSRSEAYTDNSLLPRCFDPSHKRWERTCPYERLLIERPVPDQLELSTQAKSITDGKLKIPKDTRPRKAKSWVSSPSTTKTSPGSLMSPETPMEKRVPTTSIEMSETRNYNVELLTGV